MHILDHDDREYLLYKLEKMEYNEDEFEWLGEPTG